jgi:NADH:ubiquinone oxidoreductase subunit 2 (subunit N)
MNELNLDYTLFIPEFLLAGLVVLLVVLDLYVAQVRKSWLSYIAAAGLAAVAAISLSWIDVESNFAKIFYVDNYTTYFRVFFMLIAAVICLASGKLVEDKVKHPGEYYALLVLATIGAIGKAGSRELMTAYLSLELLSFSSYILVSFLKFDERSNEAGLKYL